MSSPAGYHQSRELSHKNLDRRAIETVAQGYDHVERARTRTPGGPEEPVMTSRKLDEVATDIDDASTTVDELQAKPNQDTDTTDKLDELHYALEHASDTLDDIDNSDEIDDTDGAAPSVLSRS